MLMNSVHCEEIHFSGHVQGVGFRYAALQVAREYEISGRVCNLADGRVQLIAEGTAAEVAAFVVAIEERMHGHIRKVERKPTLSGRRFQGFEIA